MDQILAFGYRKGSAEVDMLVAAVGYTAAVVEDIHGSAEVGIVVEVCIEVVADPRLKNWSAGTLAASIS